MAITNNYKSYLQITDLPTDKLQALGKLRTVLVGTFNRSRERKHRMALLKTVIKFMHTKIVEFEKEEVKLEEAEANRLDVIKRKGILEEASELGIDLDERLTTEKLANELSCLRKEEVSKESNEESKETSKETNTKEVTE